MTMSPDLDYQVVLEMLAVYAVGTGTLPPNDVESDQDRVESAQDLFSATLALTAEAPEMAMRMLVALYQVASSLVLTLASERDQTYWGVLHDMADVFVEEEKTP